MSKATKKKGFYAERGFYQGAERVTSPAENQQVARKAN